MQDIRREYGQDAIYMLIFVHDEILFEVRADLDIRKIAARVKRGMELRIDGYCRIKVDQGYGPNWGSYGRN